MLEAMFDAASDVEGVAVVSAWHHNDEVEGVAVEFSPGFGFCAYLREARRSRRKESAAYSLKSFSSIRPSSSSMKAS